MGSMGVPLKGSIGVISSLLYQGSLLLYESLIDSFERVAVTTLEFRVEG